MIAIIPPDDLRRRIEQERIVFAEKYRCKAALKPPVHATLIAPFHASERGIGKLSMHLKTIGTMESPFNLKLSGYRAFERNGVIYIHLHEEPALKRLYKSVLPFAREAAEEPLKIFSPFTAHITIGYRDIPKELFPIAVREYQSRHFEDIMPVSHFELWKHNGKNWQTAACFPFENRPIASELF